jgi:hypothetical protein
MRRPDADLDRYLALLRDADDEPKRLALIELLIAEGARDKLAAETKLVETEPPLPQSLPSKSPALPEPSPLRSEPPANSFSGPSEESGPQDAEHLDGGRAQHFILAASSQTATAGAIAPVLSESSPADDLVDNIAKLLSSRSNMAEAAQATANTLSSDAPPPSGSDFIHSIALKIRAALAKRE